MPILLLIRSLVVIGFRPIPSTKPTEGSQSCVVAAAGRFCLLISQSDGVCGGEVTLTFRLGARGGEVTLSGFRPL